MYLLGTGSGLVSVLGQPMLAVCGHHASGECTMAMCLMQEHGKSSVDLEPTLVCPTEIQLIEAMVLDPHEEAPSHRVASVTRITVDSIALSSLFSDYMSQPLELPPIS
jgi:hypothetical protein|tara:strand:- start:462 stop:785 length:324 start_codon:yes stop_codon:yes gene_type:complete